MHGKTEVSSLLWNEIIAKPRARVSLRFRTLARWLISPFAISNLLMVLTAAYVYE